MSPTQPRFRRLFNRRTFRSLVWASAVLIAAIGVNLVGIHIMGSTNDWKQWMDRHAGHFLLWRLLLYSATACGWWWMRKRLRTREPDAATHKRLLRAEIAAIAALVTLEVSLLLRPL